MKLLLAIIGALILSAAADAFQATARFDSHKVYRLNLKDEQQINDLRELSGNFLVTILNEVRGSHPIDVVTKPSNQRKVEKQFEKLEIEFECIIEDLQSAIEEQFGGHQPERKQPRPGFAERQNKMNWTHYQSLPVIYQWLDDLAEEFPDVVTTFDIGRTYEDRPIRGVKVSYGANKPKIVINSNIHAIEWISSAVTTCFIHNLTHSNNEKLQELRSKYDFYLTPVLNPDGFTYTKDVSRLWRKNRSPTGFSNSSGPCYGIDLNRNFASGWSTNSYNYDVPCDHFYAGAYINSELEAQHWNKYMASIAKNVKMYLDFHSYGNVILLPYGYTDKIRPPNFDKMMNVSSAFADAVKTVHGTSYRFGTSGTENYFVGGSTKDTAHETYGVPFSATVELRDNGKKGFFLPKSEILDTCEEVTAGLIAMIAKAEEVGLFD